MLTAAWFGDAAREPGGLVLVVVPHSWGLDGPRTTQMLDGVAKAAEEAAQGFDAAGAVAAGAWTYERVPGCPAGPSC